MPLSLVVACGLVVGAGRVDASGADLERYKSLAATAGRGADAQVELALWCEQKGLQAEAKAHLAAVVRLDPSRDAAWKKLGCKKVDGRWISDEQATADAAEIAVQKAADAEWKPRLAALRRDLEGEDDALRAAAGDELDRLSDPRAVPAVWATFAAGPKPDHARAVQILGQLDAVSSSRALAWLALFSPAPEARRQAAEILRRRDPREFAGDLIALMRDPIRYDFHPMGGPGQPGALVVKGEKVDVARVYNPPTLNITRTDSGQYVGLDGYGRPTAIARNDWEINGVPTTRLPSSPNAMAELAARAELVRIKGEMRFAAMVAEIQKTAAVAHQQLQGDLAAVDARNDQAKRDNERVANLLADVTGQRPGQDDRTSWTQWYAGQLGYYARTEEPTPRTTVVQEVPIAYTPKSIMNAWYTPGQGYVMVSCFGAGTLVRTLDGARPIETLRVGDRVLSQSTTTGALGYQPIVAVHHNPPSPTFDVKVGGDTIVASPFHRFWVVGRGWVMARDLTGGETLRLLDGPAKVDSVSAGPVQPVFNLDVAGAHNFFAGRAAALVHDNTLPDTRLAPFDALTPALAAAAH